MKESMSIFLHTFLCPLRRSIDVVGLTFSPLMPFSHKIMYMKNFIALLICLVFCTTTLPAQWQICGGPSGGPIWQLASNGNHVFAISENNRFFHSANAGATWNTNGTICPEAINRLEVFNNMLYASSEGGGLWASANNGTSWNNLGLIGENVGPVWVNGSSLFAGTQNGIFLSTNNGASWTSMNNGLTDTVIGSLVMNGSSLFAGTQSGIFRSDNNGASWMAVNNGLSGLAFMAMTVVGNSVYAASSNGGGISVTTNNGNTWTAVNNGLSNGFGANNFVARSFQTMGSSLLIASDGGVFITNNNGGLWTAANSGLQTGLIGKIVHDIVAVGTSLLIGTRSGILLSNNNGASWSMSNEFLTNQTITSMAVDGTILLAGSYIPNMFMSTNQGISWSGYHPDFTSLQTYVGVGKVNAILVQDSFLLAGIGNNGVYKSIDHGNTWAFSTNGMTSLDVLSLGRQDSFLFAGTSNGGVFRSVDDGLTWAPFNTGLPMNFLGDVITRIYDFAVVDNELYVGTGKSNFNGAVYKTSNYGGNWVKVSNGIDPQFDVVTLAVQGNKMIAGSESGIYASDNQGVNWTLQTNGLSNLLVHDIFVLDTNIYVATLGGGVFVSADSTASWTSMNQGLDFLEVNTLTADPQYIYAGTNGGSIFRYKITTVPNSLPTELSTTKPIQLYPNPANQGITLMADHRGDFILYTAEGKALMAFSLLAHQSLQVDVSAFPDGVYFIRDADATPSTKQTLLIRH